MKRMLALSAMSTTIAVVLATALLLSAGPTVAFGASSWGTCTPGQQRLDRC